MIHLARKLPIEFHLVGHFGLIAHTPDISQRDASLTREVLRCTELVDYLVRCLLFKGDWCILFVIRKHALTVNGVSSLAFLFLWGLLLTPSRVLLFGGSVLQENLNLDIQHQIDWREEERDHQEANDVHQ
jgi:hypothetical protein